MSLYTSFQLHIDISCCVKSWPDPDRLSQEWKWSYGQLRLKTWCILRASRNLLCPATVRIRPQGGNSGPRVLSVNSGSALSASGPCIFFFAQLPLTRTLRDWKWMKWMWVHERVTRGFSWGYSHHADEQETIVNLLKFIINPLCLWKGEWFSNTSSYWEGVYTMVRGNLILLYTRYLVSLVWILELGVSLRMTGKPLWGIRVLDDVDDWKIDHDEKVILDPTSVPYHVSNGYAWLLTVAKSIENYANWILNY